MRRAANIDKNQPEIVAQLRKAGVSVQPLHTAGNGVPDLLCGWRQVNILLELKVGQDKLNQMQEDWHGKWAGQKAVVRTFDEAMAEIIRVERAIR